MSIAVSCNKCRSTFQVKDKYAGRPAACPICRESLYVPTVAQYSATNDAAWRDVESEPETLAMSSPATPTPSLPPGKLAFPCETCGRPLVTDVQHVGRKIRCGTCQHKFLVPATSLPIAPRAPLSRLPTTSAPTESQQAPRVTSRDPTVSNPAPLASSVPPGTSAPSELPVAEFAEPLPDSRSADKRATKSVRDPRILRPRKAMKATPEPAEPPVLEGIWSEITQKDFEGGSDAKPSEDPLAPPTHTDRPARVFTTAYTPLEHRNESAPISNKRAMSLGGTILLVLLLLLKSAARYERSQRGSANRAQSAAMEREDQQVIDAVHVFDLKAAYYLPGADPSVLSQGHFFLDLEVRGTIPPQGCKLYIKSPKTRGYVDVHNPHEFAGLMRFDFQVLSDQKADQGPFTAWMEEGSSLPVGGRHRISNVIHFQQVSAPPPY